MTSTVVAPPTPAQRRALPSSAGSTTWPRAATRWLWRWARTLIRLVPLTPLGALAIFLFQWIVRFALNRQDMVLLALSLGGFVLVAAALVQVLVTAAYLRIRKETPSAEPLSLETGVPCRTGYRLGRIGWNPLVQIDLTWEKPGGVGGQLVTTWAGQAEEVVAGERALETQIIRRFTVRDVLGLARLSLTRRMQRKVECRPACGQVLGLPLLPQLVPGDELEHPEGKPEGELIEMRSYANGDPMRLVLWKVYARTGQMLVRVPERAVARSQQALIYFVAGDGDEASAGIARTALETGQFGPDFLFGADGDPTTATTAPDSIARIVGSVRARHQGGTGLGAFLAHGASQGLKSCTLFVPDRPGVWLEQVAAAMSGHSGPFRILIGVNQIGAPKGRNRLLRLLVRRPAQTGSNPAELLGVVQRLQAQAAEVHVLNRITGETIDLAAVASGRR